MNGRSNRTRSTCCGVLVLDRSNWNRSMYVVLAVPNRNRYVHCSGFVRVAVLQFPDVDNTKQYCMRGFCLHRGTWTLLDLEFPRFGNNELQLGSDLTRNVLVWKPSLTVEDGRRTSTLLFRSHRNCRKFSLSSCWGFPLEYAPPVYYTCCSWWISWYHCSDRRLVIDRRTFTLYDRLDVINFYWLCVGLTGLAWSLANSTQDLECDNWC